MTSMDLDSKASMNRSAALSKLKFNRKNRANIPSGERQEDVSLSTSTTTHNKPPAQSRDATQSSRFFGAPRPATVLAPNSSPLGDRAHSSSSSGTPSCPPPPIGTHAIPSYYTYMYTGLHDPLSAPSFASTTAFGRRSVVEPSSVSTSQITSHWHDTLPKSLPYQSPPTSSSVPESPEVKRLGKRRRVDVSPSDIESIADSSSSPLAPDKTRIVRGIKTEVATPAPPVDEKLYLFRLINQQYPQSKIDAAFRLCDGDVKQATTLLFDPSFSPSPSAVSMSPPSIVANPESRIKEETKKREREDLRNKQKQSTIYAKRATLGTLDNPIGIPSSPLSPVGLPPRPPKLRKATKRVVESDDSDFMSEEDQLLITPAIQAKSKDYYQLQALKWFNSPNVNTLMELSGCSRPQAEEIVRQQPFTNVQDLKTKLGQGKRKAGPKGLSPNIFDECVNILTGYTVVDDVLDECEKIGSGLQDIMNEWAPQQEKIQDVIAFTELPTKKSSTNFLKRQPKGLSNQVTLKEYQLLGVNWLHLLHSKKLSAILADEMGLGKTIQVISLLAHLKDRGNHGPHLIVVPSSTLENWCREFERFAPGIQCQTYYAGKEDRQFLRERLNSTCAVRNPGGWEVLVTTYNLAQGDELDRKFFRKMGWDSCIFDEGHVLKNFDSQRYKTLMSIGSKWRLLLTGTPLQNNLQELVSLMNFIHPDLFEDALEDLRSIFKVKADSAASLLSQDRVSRAKKMMTPFVLRRRKDQVLKDLPRKAERVEWCDLTNLQREIYREALQRSRKVIVSSIPGTPETLSSAEDSTSENKFRKAKPLLKSKLQKDTSSNVLMDLRKAATHPMLFRRRFADKTLTDMAKVLLKQPEFVKRGAVFEYVKEDMEVMTDSELHALCDQHKDTRRFALDPSVFTEAGKISKLLSLLATYREQSRRVLIFSQFTQVLDILKVVLDGQCIRYLVLTGSTPVDVRQSLVDEFNEDVEIPVFLLSTRAGGMGINLTAASVVIIFDQDFNPHNDRQAADRAYRIGQTRDVDVIKLISRDTVEEDMLRLGETKLALDEAVAGEDGDKRAEKIMKESLMSTLRKQLEGENKGALEP